MLPARALTDRRITSAHLHVLAACGVHAKPWGEFWATLARLIAVTGHCERWVKSVPARPAQVEVPGANCVGTTIPRIKRKVLDRRVNKSKRLPAFRQICWTADWPPLPRTEAERQDPTLRTQPLIAERVR